MFKVSLYKIIGGVLTAFVMIVLVHDYTAYGSANDNEEKKYYAEQPRSAYDFYDSLGICAHVSVYSTNYGDRQEVLRQLQYLDIKYVRDDVRGSFEKMLETYRFFGRHGIKFNTIVGKYVPHPSEYKKELKQLAPYLVAVEGANEIDNIHRRIPFDPDAREIYEKAIEHQYELYNTIKNMPETANLPVYNFTAVMHEHNDKLRKFIKNKMEVYGQPIADYDTIHAYDQTGRGPGKDTKKWAERYSILENLPKVLTETGYTTIKYSPENHKKSGWRGVSQEVSAKLTLNTIVSSYKWGIRKTYIYQLQDDISDPDHLDKEFHFGLFDSHNEPKPAAVGIRNMRLILKEDVLPTPSGNEENAPFSWWVEQTNSHEDYDFDTHHLLLRKADGVHFLIVWAEPEIWNPKTHAPVTTPIDRNDMTIGFETPMSRLAVYDPLTGETAQKTHEDSDTVTLTVTDHPVILEIMP